MTPKEKARLGVLADKFLKNTISASERAELEAWFREQRDEPLDLPSGFAGDETELEERMFAAIRQRTGQRKERRMLTLWPRIAAAASIILAIGGGAYFTLHRTQKPTEIAQIKPGTFKNDVKPGNKAILTLANGQQLAVSNIPAGHINNTNVQKTAAGALVYAPAAETADVYNTLTVPRGGGKHELRLADGTLAILDAESSIRFPVAFNGKDRKVTITGQVYFEVIHKNDQPFYVTVGNETIEDKGTHFNVNAFDGEIRTTLIEGSITVNNILIKPGEQAVQKASGTIAINNNVDEAIVLGWKNDLFKFGPNTSLQMVMNQLSRWYDMDVVYEGSTKTYHFGGDMPRYSNLSDVLKILAYNGVQFSIDGKKIIVYQ